MKGIPSPGQGFESWATNVTSPDAEENMSEFTMHCVHEILSLVEDVIAVMGQVAYIIQARHRKLPPIPDSLPLARKDDQLRQSLQATYDTIEECLECMAAAKFRLDALSTVWNDRMQSIPATILEAFDSHDESGKMSAVQTHWLAAFAAASQQSYDISAFLRCANVSRCLFSRPWVQKLMFIQEDFMVVWEDLRNIRDQNPTKAPLPSRVNDLE
jgi:hypothetical protein